MADGQITIGNVQITGLSDAELEHPLTLDRLFPSICPSAWEEYRGRYPKAFGKPGRWHANIGSYLLRSMGRTILVDAGAGAAGGPVAASMGLADGGRLLQALQSAGVNPEEIDVVCITHLHRDHVGWLLREDGGQPRLTFPNARYVVHRADWETFHRAEIQAALRIDYMEQGISPLEGLGALDLASADYRITEEVTAIHTSGHTPGHMCVMIASGGQQAVITGDLIVNPVQLADPDAAFNFDMDAEAARRSRRSLVEQIEAGGLISISGHFPAPGFGRLVREDARLWWQAL